MVVVFAAAVFALQAAVAQDALLAVLPASQPERVRAVPRAAQLVVQDDLQAALLERGALLAVHSVASRDDPQGAQWEPAVSPVVRLDALLVDLRGALPEPDALPVVRSDAQSAVHSVASPADLQGGQQDDCLVARSADGR